MKRALAFLAALCLALGALTGCDGGNSGADGAPEKKVLVIGDTTFNPENAEPDVNPHNDYGGWATIRYGIGETLFKLSDEMELTPWLATGWENVDEYTWRITLREGVRFSSGRGMDAAAVKQCLEHLVGTHDRAPTDLMLKSVEADGNVLTIKTSAPRPALLNYLCDPYGCIIDVDAGFAGGIVAGTGPYVAVECVSGDHLRLVKNEDYWGGTPHIDELVIRTISDGDTLAAALQSGGIDAAYGMAYDAYGSFRNDGYRFSQCATSRAFLCWMNYESPVASDPAVRRAIAMGIDKEGFVNYLLEGNGEVARGAFPDSFAFGGSRVTAESYDAEGARAVLEAAGWVDTDGDGIREKDGRRLTVRWLTYPSRQELPKLAEFAHATLRDVGIEVDVNCTANHNAIVADTGAWDVYASANVNAGIGDPEAFFTSFCLDASPKNRGHFHSERMEELAERMAVEFDPAKRAQLAVDMQQVILDDNAWVFCSFLKMSMISRSNVVGYDHHPTDFYQVTAELDVISSGG